MWLKVFLLLAYILLLFVLSRVLEALSWSENGYSGILSRQLLDPMVLSVVKLKALLELRGISYEGVVEKSELLSLVDSSGLVSADEVGLAQMETLETPETNFTCGAHFIEQVEDAKDSVWLVQVVRHSDQLRIVGDIRWKAIRKKVTMFGVRTGLLDCSLDHRYCSQKGWHSPFLLLALPSQFEKKASIAMHNYSGPVHETVVLHWVRDKLSERVMHIRDPISFRKDWQNITNNPLDPEIRVVLFTKSTSAPLFYSALTVKFPGRVKFGLVSVKSDRKVTIWKPLFGKERIVHLPSYIIYSAERNYTYGGKSGEQFSFASMERFLKFLYPCLNDIFITSFCAANIMSVFEFFVSNCSIMRRTTKCIWCIITYNIIVIMLWLPTIGIFQMPFLDRVPLIALKLERIVSTSQMGIIFRGDYSFFQNHPVYIYLSFILYLISVTLLCRKYREEEDETESWFNFSHSASLVHLRPSNLLEPMGLSGYDFLGGIGSRLSQQSLWLQQSISPEYIKHLRTWCYCPPSIAEKAAENVRIVEKVIALQTDSDPLKKLNLSHKKEEFTEAMETSAALSRKCNTCENKPSNMTMRSSHDSRQFETSGHCVEHHFTSTTTVTTHEISGHGVDRVPPLTGLVDEIQLHENWEGQSVRSLHPFVSNHSNISQEMIVHYPTEIPHCCPGQETEITTDSTVQNQPNASNNAHMSSSNSSVVNYATSSETHTSTSIVTEATAGPITSCGSDRLASSLQTKCFPTGYIESLQCVICLEEYMPNIMLCGLPCGHVFHETCIIAWLNREKHFCPMCRWPSYQLLIKAPQN